MLAAVTINGTCKVGLNLLVFTIHPMKLGATLMSSFLFNVALVLLASTAVIQFCSQAFSLYAYQTAIYEIFSDQVRMTPSRGSLLQRHSKPWTADD